MIYKQFQDLSLSSLGLGTMRLPIVADDNAEIDEEKSAEMVAYAMENGINYYDTAYGYHGGNSERVMGRILSKYPREKFYLASKFPGYDVENLKNKEKVFAEQLKKCQVDYFDFYLFHTVSDGNVDNYLDPQYGLMDYLQEEKKNGRIRHLGFSSHGSLATLKRFLEAYADKLEFVQIQLNWLDWTYQLAKEQYDLVTSYNLPVWVMEPLRGGRLVNLSDKQSNKLASLRDESMPAWSFRFLQSLPEVTMILSGMSNMEQLQENIKIFSKDAPLNKEEKDSLLQLGKEILEEITVPCTSCRYCTPNCPMELDIPYLLEAYNDAAFRPGKIKMPGRIKDLAEEKRPSACIACRACEGACPQNILISQALHEFAARMEE